MRLFNSKEIRRTTIEAWAAHPSPADDLEYRRAWAMGKLDPETCTDGQVDAAYGGDGWRSIAPCVECGKTPNLMALLASETISLCAPCAQAAVELIEPPLVATQIPQITRAAAYNAPAVYGGLVSTPVPVKPIFIQRVKAALGLTPKGT
jgi:hypothetical protein